MCGKENAEILLISFYSINPKVDTLKIDQIFEKPKTAWLKIDPFFENTKKAP